LGPIGFAVLTFIGYKQTNKHPNIKTDKQTDRQAKFIYRLPKIKVLFKSKIIKDKFSQKIPFLKKKHFGKKYTLYSGDSVLTANLGGSWRPGCPSLAVQTLNTCSSTLNSTARYLVDFLSGLQTNLKLRNI